MSLYSSDCNKCAEATFPLGWSLCMDGNTKKILPVYTHNSVSFYPTREKALDAIKFQNAIPNCDIQQNITSDMCQGSWDNETCQACVRCTEKICPATEKICENF